MEEQSYFPPDPDEDYGEFVVRTPFGERVKQHLAGFNKEFEFA